MENVINYLEIVKYVSAALLVGVGSVGVAISQGKIAQKACESLAQNEAAEKGIRGIFTMGMFLVEASAVYCLLIALILLFVV